MAVRTRSGRTLSEADLDRLVARAEAGFDLTAWRPRRGRPSLDASSDVHSPRMSVRVPEELRVRVLARASAEQRTVSDVLRALLEDYAVDHPTPGPPRLRA
jgi:hypothetical protein